MLTDEQVREIQDNRDNCEFEDCCGVKRLLDDREELVAEIGRLKQLWLEYGCEAAAAGYTIQHYQERISELEAVAEAAKAYRHLVHLDPMPEQYVEVETLAMALDAALAELEEGATCAS